jgi:hypothetical protein
MDAKQRLDQMLKEMDGLVRMTNKRSVLILIQHTKEDDFEVCIPSVRESISNIIGFVSIGDDSFLPYLIDRSVGIVDTIMLDIDFKRRETENIRIATARLAESKGISVAYYSDYSTWISSAIAFMMEIVRKKEVKTIFDSKLLLVGRNALATRMVLELLSKGIEVCVFEKEYPTPTFPLTKGKVELESPFIHRVNPVPGERFDILIGCEIQSQCSFLRELSTMDFEQIFDIGINNFSQDFIRQQRQRGAEVYRSDDRAGISGIVVNLMETSELVNSRLGKTSVGGIPIVSGGLIGDFGDVVVDNFNEVHVVLGIANGDGTFKQDLSSEDEINMRRINKLL